MYVKIVGQKTLIVILHARSTILKLIPFKMAYPMHFRYMGTHPYVLVFRRIGYIFSPIVSLFLIRVCSCLCCLSSKLRARNGRQKINRVRGGDVQVIPKFHSFCCCNVEVSESNRRL